MVHISFIWYMQWYHITLYALYVMISTKILCLMYTATFYVVQQSVQDVLFYVYMHPGSC